MVLACNLNLQMVIGGIFVYLMYCACVKGPLLEGCCTSAVVKCELFLTDELKRTLCRHNLVNWAAVGKLYL